MGTINLLYKREYPITDKIHVMIPTVGEVVDNEDLYYELVTSLTSVPRDMMVQLDDIGIDFTKISEYDLFIALFNGVRASDTRLIFGDLDLSKFETVVNTKTEQIVLYDEEHDIMIDKGIQNQIAQTLRKINHLEKNIKKPGNEETKQYLIKRERLKQQRRKNRKTFSQLEQLIVALVNTEQFKYGFDEVRNLTIYQFNESLHQIAAKIDYDNLMRGVYAGTVKTSDISPDRLNWLSHK